MPESSLYFYSTASRANYIYDSNSNKIFELDAELWESLKQGEAPPQDYSAGGFLQHRGIRRFTCLSYGDFRSEIDTNIEKLTIEVTQACNLACGYCPYNENFFSFQGRSSSLSISLGKALEAVRFFFDHSGENNHKGISFYGGEPLLDWDIITKTVAFARQLAKPSQQLLFGVTTNGTLLEYEEICRFLAANDFAVHVSLDGPPAIHDRFRRDHSGAGSFSSIQMGLDTLRRHYKEKFHRLVHVNAVITPLTDLEETRDFFRNFEFIQEGQLRVNNVSMEGAKPELRNLFSNEATQIRFNLQLRDLRNHYLRCLAEGNEPELLERALFDRQFRTLYSRHVDETEVPRRQTIPVPAICIPCQKKLFVDARGKFFICEKLNNFKSFGDLDRGIDTRELYQFYASHIEDFVQRSCASCWAKRLCSLCYVPFFQNGGRSIGKRKQKCEQLKRRIKQDLVDYTTVLEKNPRGFDFFTPQTEETN